MFMFIGLLVLLIAFWIGDGWLSLIVLAVAAWLGNMRQSRRLKTTTIPTNHEPTLLRRYRIYQQTPQNSQRTLPWTNG
ncbi:hypothetical protein MGA5115_02677 [Marinomonas gallaica]|uniref:Uncharacterized protein n=1 Tax=Marinomonas gallaica TaxID=1806667 RepID=A0A1C3JTY3_9GAMM|nr:hypothetical protein MGA5115_02677 [Marinomonas gallaica]SBT22745.1 hypothetical protein MGA5116_03375 [Marinomonas gallaica]